MGFTLSGSIITQTGIDNDLSGLNGITGVNVVANGNGGAVFTNYFAGDVQLLIEGELTIDPTKECLIFGDNPPNQTITVSALGTLNYGVQKTVNGYTYETRGTGIIIPNATKSACCSGESFDVRPTGTFNWYGGTIQIAACMRWQLNSVVKIKNGVLEATRGALFRLRSYPTDLNIDGLVMYGSVSIDFFRSPNSFKGFVPQGGSRACEAVSTASGGTDDVYLFRDYNSFGMALDFSVWQGADLHFLNLEKTDQILLTNQNSNASMGLARVSKEFSMKVVNDYGLPLYNAKYFIQATNGGNTEDAVPRSGMNYKLLENKHYTSTTDVNGKTDTQEILTRFAHRFGQTGRVVPNWYYLGKNSGIDDIFTISIVHYNQNITITDQALKGAGEMVLEWTLFEDALITEADKSIVEGYTEINTSTAFYDYAKLYLLDNYTGETETIVTRIEDTIDARNYDVVLDSNALNVFDFDGNTITIKANAFTGNIKTTGVVTLNGATINGGIIDANGDSFLSFLGVLTDWKLYDNQADAKSFQNELASGPYNEIYRFNFTGQKDYYYRIAGVLDKLTVSESGETAVDLSLAAQIKRLNSNMVTYDMLKGLINSARDKVLSAIQMIF